MGEEITHLVLGIVQAVLIALLVWAGRTLHARTLDPSEVQTLRQYAPQLHEITELRADIAQLRQALHENGLDRGELRRVRAFFFGTEQREAEVHKLREAGSDAARHCENHEMRIAALEVERRESEVERRESNRRLDQRLDRLEAQLSDQVVTLTQILQRMPTPPGTRGTPPDGSPIPGAGE